jgi:hypothetical protein
MPADSKGMTSAQFRISVRLVFISGLVLRLGQPVKTPRSLRLTLLPD